MSGQSESETTIALLLKDTAILQSGFGSVRTKNITISSDSFPKIDNCYGSGLIRENLWNPWSAC
jgi:hypothetical protein